MKEDIYRGKRTSLKMNVVGLWRYFNIKASYDYIKYYNFKKLITNLNIIHNQWLLDDH